MFSKQEMKDLSLAFWHKLESKTRRLPGQNGRAKVWIATRTGIPHLDLRFDVNRQHCIVALEIRNMGSESSAALWEKLLSCKSLFEETYGDTLIWDEAYQKEAGDIVYHMKFGKGKVVKINKNEKFIYVKFMLGEKKFMFPNAFLMGFLVMV